MSFHAAFVSDLHLKANDEKNAQIFVRFLRRLHDENHFTHLFLLGDVFDFWVSDHGYFIEKYSNVVEELDRIVRKGVEVHFFEGNHDLHLEKYWQRKLGIRVHNEPSYFQLGSKTLRIEHGDLMDPDDKGYAFLKSILNTSTVKYLADNIHESLISKVGELGSRASRHYTSHSKVVSDENKKAKQHSYVLKKFEEKKFDLFVAGHIHVRIDEAIELGDQKIRSLNLGTWLDQPVVLVLSESLCEFQSLL